MKLKVFYLFIFLAIGYTGGINITSASTSSQITRQTCRDTYALNYLRSGIQINLKPPSNPHGRTLNYEFTYAFIPKKYDEYQEFSFSHTYQGKTSTYTYRLPGCREYFIDELRIHEKPNVRCQDFKKQKNSTVGADGKSELLEDLSNYMVLYLTLGPTLHPDNTITFIDQSIWLSPFFAKRRYYQQEEKLSVCMQIHNDLITELKRTNPENLEEYTAKYFFDRIPDGYFGLFEKNSQYRKFNNFASMNSTNAYPDYIKSLQKTSSNKWSKNCCHEKSTNEYCAMCISASLRSMIRIIFQKLPKYTSYEDLINQVKTKKEGTDKNTIIATCKNLDKIKHRFKNLFKRNKRNKRSEIDDGEAGRRYKSHKKDYPAIEYNGFHPYYLREIINFDFSEGIYEAFCGKPYDYDPR